MAAGRNPDEGIVSAHDLGSGVSLYAYENSKWLDHAATKLLPSKSSVASSKERLKSFNAKHRVSESSTSESDA